MNNYIIKYLSLSFIRSNYIFEFDDTAKPKSKDVKVYHIVTIVLIKGPLYELDRLKEGPNELGLIKPNRLVEAAAKPFIEKRISK